MKKGRYFLLVVLCMLCLYGAATAEGTVTLVLGDSTPTNGNKAYKKDSRAYDRDVTYPLINGDECVFVSQTAASTTYLVTSLPDENGQITIDFPYEGGEWTTVEVDGKLLSKDKPVEVEIGKDLALRVAAKNMRCVMHLTISTMPLIMVDYTGSDLYANQVPGTMTVYDPDYKANGQKSMVTEYEITIGYRGQSSLNYDKHNYTVHLWQNGEQYKTSILGMRKDDDWILSGAMNDQLRMRNDVAMQLWDEYYTLPWTDVSGAIDGEYCELYMRGKYIGLYRLMERLDRKQVDIDKKNGQMVRSVQAEAGGVNLMGFDNLGKKLPQDNEIWYNMEMKYPKPDDMSAADWNEFYEFLRFVKESDDQTFAANIGKYIDIDNFAHYYVYVTAIGATGNMVKNLYFIMNDKTEDARWYLVPWDVDGSFGRRNNASKRDVEVLSSNNLFERLVTLNAQGFVDRCREIWKENRDTVFSYEHMMEAFQTRYDALATTGVWQRETKRWPKFKTYTFDIDKEMAYLYEYMEQRWDFVDGYFNGDNLSARKWIQ